SMGPGIIAPERPITIEEKNIPISAPTWLTSRPALSGSLTPALPYGHPGQALTSIVNKQVTIQPDFISTQ
ncbi:MAG: hypothetical protein L6427_06220, partial [Actinomycetia bacterium]|nr:hypothetical protein [Actinomycetes bacterium]